MPHDEVRVARRAVDVGDVGVEPDDRRREVRVGQGTDGRSEGERPGQEVEPDVRPGRPPEQLLDLAVRLGLRQRAVELDEHLVGTGSPRWRAISPASSSATSAFAAVPRAEQLHDVQAVVVRLDERGQRSALAQGRHVPGRRHGAEHRGECRSRAGRACGRTRPGISLQVQLSTDGAEPDMDPTIHDALDHSQTVDITTTGRRSGEARRIEIVLHSIGGRLVISGMPEAADARLDLQPRGGPAHHRAPQARRAGGRRGDGARHHRSHRAARAARRRRQGVEPHGR